uniref:Ubiquitin associated and SH3 domain containing Bb n=1 Tax=Oncorhynchus mykiss TaxID=8022 RepID=A0A8C7TWL4_ONCMY
MGFPKTRALKALVSTGGRNVQAACDWLFSHVDDPFLDDPLPREYVLYLRPSGPLQNQLHHFWQQSRVTCGKNKAHNIFPHITLCQFFMCADNKVDALLEALQATVDQWRGRFPSPLPLELYTSFNFIGLFVEEQIAEVLKQFAADFASEAARKADVHLEPHKKQLHVTLAYHFPTSHLTSLEKLAKGIEVKLGCDWLAVLFSRDIRFANHETLRVMYPYAPQNEDELELVPGDFVFMSPLEQNNTSEGWVYGSSLATGLSGLLPENYVSRADECDTWRTLFVCRHGERMDVVFGKHWLSLCSDSKGEQSQTNGTGGAILKASVLSKESYILSLDESDVFDRIDKRAVFFVGFETITVVCWIVVFCSTGRYVRTNLNMPVSLPMWSGGHRDYNMDTPITVFGSTQARIVGEALLESNTVIDFVYCSPSLRCVQTAQNILKGLQQDGKLKIRVEPGLFEWTKWVSGRLLLDSLFSHTSVSHVLTVSSHRPLIPITKLSVSESYDTYMSRSYQVTKDILSDCKNMGNNILIVAHASSLEACTRQLQGRSPQTSKDFIQVVRKIPYLGFCSCEEQSDTGIWQLVDPPILPLTHGPNHSFNWKETLLQE